MEENGLGAINENFIEKVAEKHDTTASPLDEIHAVQGGKAITEVHSPNVTTTLIQKENTISIEKFPVTLGPNDVGTCPIVHKKSSDVILIELQLYVLAILIFLILVSWRRYRKIINAIYSSNQGVIQPLKP